MKRGILALALVGAVVMPMRLNGQATTKSRSAGFFLGLGLEGNAIAENEDNAPTESGNGGGLVLGYGFSPRWSIVAQFSGAAMEAERGGEYALAHFDIGTRVHFRSGPSIVVPFVQLALSGRAIGEDVNGTDVTASGAGFTFGGGLNAHFTPAVALSAALTWTVGDFTDYKVDGRAVEGEKLSATSGRLHLGLIWFPRR
jgi:hypothetical protein